MILFQTANKKTRLSAIELSIRTFKANMGEQFTLLFSHHNGKHMFLALDGQKVVSMVNYYPSRITLNGIQFNVASIGSVCTDTAYRGQNLASKLLINAEQAMIQSSIDFTIISGSGGIYEKFGARDVGYNHEYLIPIEQFPKDETMHIRVYQDCDFEDIYALYQNESYRYLRTKAEFKQLLKSQTVADTYCTYPVVVIEKERRIVGYVILNHYEDATDLWVKEFAGNRQTFYNAIQALLTFFKKTEIHLVVSAIDPLNGLFSTKPHKIITQEASIKIIHRADFVSKINHYFSKQKADYELSISGAHYVLKGQQKRHQLNDDELLLLIFNGQNSSEIWHEREIQSMGFPLPLPWSHNLNYQ
ncbi:MAG: GNAT family N-acetyltransferase [Acholeplasma sp.]|jgi:predicted acetyltransferase|nr:GNAT family N-acetyltransferase [Acholeplasma sp.]